MSNYIIQNGELYHYGVKGMKWGVRRAQKLVGKAERARASYQKYDEKARALQARGRAGRAQKYAAKAAEYERTANRMQGKADRSVERRYAKAGKAAGRADFYRGQGDKKYNEYDAKAKALEKQAKYEDKNGRSVTALRLRDTAKGLRSEGERARQEQIDMADYYLKKSNALKQKADSFSTSTRVNLGKSKVDAILKSAKDKGYNAEKDFNDYSNQPDPSKYDREYDLARLRY